jgi:hypothetical protein
VVLGLDVRERLVNHEEAAIKAFILPVRRERYLEFVKSPKKRAKFIKELVRFNHVDARYIVRVPGDQQNPASLVKLLVGMGAPAKCWVISEASELDGQEIDLQAALEKTVGYGMRTFISCLPGKLAYCEDEEIRYILKR